MSKNQFKQTKLKVQAVVTIRHESLPRNSAVRKPDLAVSVIRPNPNFRFSNMGA